MKETKKEAAARQRKFETKWNRNAYQTQEESLREEGFAVECDEGCEGCEECS